MWYIHLFLCSVSKNAFLIKVATLKMWDIYGNLFLFCWKRHELLLDFCNGKSKSILLTTRRNSVDVESWRSTPTAKVKSKQTSSLVGFLTLPSIYQKRRWNKSWYGYKLVNSKRNPRNSTFHVISWLLFTFSSINCQQNIEVPNPECWRKYGRCFLLEQSSILLSYFWRRVALLMLPTLEMSFHHYSLIPPLSSVYKTCCFHS